MLVSCADGAPSEMHKGWIRDSTEHVYKKWAMIAKMYLFLIES